MHWRNHRTLFLFIATLLTLACLPTLGPASAPIPTFDANAPLTAIVETAAVAGTQTAVNAPPTPTPSPLPTKTPTDTPTATATFLFLVPTRSIPPTQIPLGHSQADFECQVLSVEPQGLVGARAAFIAKWIVANIGQSTWLADNVDYRYSEGDKIHLQSIYDFPANVPPGSTVELTVDMQAPATAGEYYTKWMINSGKRAFCPMELKITVN